VAGWKRTPAPRRRASQARSSGAAFISAGKTRPELPTKVLTPSPRPRPAGRPARRLEHRLDLGPAAAVAPGEGLEGFRMGDVEPALAGQQELAAHRGHGVEDVHLHAARGQGLGRHQAGGAAADDGDVEGGGAGVEAWRSGAG
jgi:hypothetical protein